MQKKRDHNHSRKEVMPMESLMVLLALLAGIVGLIATLTVAMILLATHK